MKTVFRVIRHSDFEAYYALAKEAHLGFTTLPKDRELLKKRLEHAIDSFKKEVTKPNGEFYLFVAEEVVTHKVIGVSAISATTGDGDEPLFFFKKEIIYLQNSMALSSGSMKYRHFFAHMPRLLFSIFTSMSLSILSPLEKLLKYAQLFFERSLHQALGLSAKHLQQAQASCMQVTIFLTR